MKKILLLILLIYFIPLNSHTLAMSPAFEQSAVPNTIISLTTPSFVQTDDDGYQIFGASVTNSFTPVSGTNRCFFAFVWWNGAVECTGATFDGNAMTQITEERGATNSEMEAYYYCTDSGTSAINVIASFDGDTKAVLWVVQVDGVKTSDPVHQFDTDYSHNEATTQLDALTVTTTVNNNRLISVVGTNLASQTITVCSSTGQTLFGDNSHTDVTSNGGHFDLSTAGTKQQCFDGGTGFYDMVGILLSIAPVGS